jgi:hypothetical protein
MDKHIKFVINIVIVVLCWTQLASNNVSYWVVSNSVSSICVTSKIQNAIVVPMPGTNWFYVWAISKWDVQSGIAKTNLIVKTTILK